MDSYQLASSYVRHTSRCVFLTGKAGTGKTTFLRNLHDESLKQMAVVAPTGVAAINAGGATTHSFSQIAASFVGSWCQGIPLTLFVA